MNAKPVVGRHQRLISILEQLKSGCPLNATQLAHQCQISKRTVFRDLDLLRDAGVPLEFDKNVCGYRIPESGGAARLPSFDANELTVLTAAIHFSVLQSLPGFHDQLRNATLKLLSTCSFRIRQSVTRMTDACAMRGFAHASADQTEHTVTNVLQAIGQRRMLNVVIAEPTCKPLQTALAPYEVIATPSNWQVVGRTEHHRDIRTFDSRTLIRTEITDNAFALPRKYERPSLGR